MRDIVAVAIWIAAGTGWVAALLYQPMAEWLMQWVLMIGMMP